MSEVTITMCYFARARELAGCDDEAVRVPATTDVATVFKILSARHPALEPLLACSRLAVRQAFAKDLVEVADGDECAVIPPVSGG